MGDYVNCSAEVMTILCVHMSRTFGVETGGWLAVFEV